MTDKDNTIKNIALEMLWKRPDNCHKGEFGYVALVGGSLEYSGAIRLAAMANASMRSGAGVATVAAPGSICNIVAASVLESTIFPLSDKDGELVFCKNEFEKLIQKYDCIAFGMGLGLSEETKKAVHFLLEKYEGVLILDADGLNALASFEDRIDLLKKSKADILLTPHVGEFKRLITKDEDSKEFAKNAGCTVLLKGHTTTITDGDKTYFVTGGSPGMATAGSGDVLSGILSAVCAYNKGYLTKAAVAGVYINCLAGELAESENSDISMTSKDTADCIKKIINKLASDR